MAISATAVIEGTVIRTSVREITAKATGQQFTFTNMLVIGEDTLVDVRIPDGEVVPVAGAEIKARVKVSSYRNEAEFELDAYLV